jgi:signal transduction histidine kinase
VANSSDEPDIKPGTPERTAPTTVQALPRGLTLDELKARLRLTQKLETIGRMAGRIAHEFNNLLTVIVGFSQVLLDGKGQENPEFGRKLLLDMQRAAHQGASLTNQLLAFGRAKPAGTVLLDLGDLVGGLEPILRGLLGKQHLLHIDRKPELGEVLADPDQLEQVVLNLVLNARDAMPHGGQVTIEVANVVLENAAKVQPRTVPPGPYVLLAVNDTGCGMTADIKAHLFEPFFTTKEPGQGTGLGLAITWDIVQEAFGAIQVISAIGWGTTVRVYLPRIATTVATMP